MDSHPFTSTLAGNEYKEYKDSIVEFKKAASDHQRIVVSLDIKTKKWVGRPQSVDDTVGGTRTKSKASDLNVGPWGTVGRASPSLATSLALSSPALLRCPPPLGSVISDLEGQGQAPTLFCLHGCFRAEILMIAETLEAR
eukprot:8063145-Pyramimonas_sp.AAC.1